MNDSFPWHEQIWSKLTSDIENIPHALLFSGQTGIGKLLLAKRFANLLLCDSPVFPDKISQKYLGEACGLCKSCKLNAAGTHPDFIYIVPEETKKLIIVDQTRELSRQLQLKSHIAKRKVAIIHPAESMNINASNSLLKILEEPPQNNVILLVTNKYSQLAMTIKSRCINFTIPLPDDEIATSWLQAQKLQESSTAYDTQSLLKFSGGAPLLAYELAQRGFPETRSQLLNDVLDIAKQKLDFSVCAKKWKETGADLCLMWFQSFLADLVKITLASKSKAWNNAQTLTNQELNTGLQLPKKPLNLIQLFDFFDVVSESRKLLAAPMDEQLLIEDILIRWQGLIRA